MKILENVENLAFILGDKNGKPAKRDELNCASVTADLSGDYCVSVLELYCIDFRERLHWLPVHFRINYKLCLLMHQIHNSRAPS